MTKITPDLLDTHKAVNVCIRHESVDVIINNCSCSK